VPGVLNESGTIAAHATAVFDLIGAPYLGKTPGLWSATCGSSSGARTWCWPSTTPGPRRPADRRHAGDGHLRPAPPGRLPPGARPGPARGGGVHPHRARRRHPAGILRRTRHRLRNRRAVMGPEGRHRLGGSGPGLVRQHPGRSRTPLQAQHPHAMTSASAAPGRCCTGGLSDCQRVLPTVASSYSWPGGQFVGSGRRRCAEAAFWPVGQGPQPAAALPTRTRADLRRLPAPRAATGGCLAGPLGGLVRPLAAGRPGAGTDGPARSLGQRADRTGGDRLRRRSGQDRHSAGLPRRYRRSPPTARCCLRPAAVPPARRRDPVATALRHPLRPAAAARLIVAGGRTVMPLVARYGRPTITA
jgi:hypothetical protein